ncbi:FecR family protein [Chitinophaga eiseniae]|uniref:Ferric-dicitrate binding protein FerR, regulates iron transport through sigma-19 n=1 Tax=Chitinophaga eiseniae TaxID=634771 RepID=A0A847SCW1_9BACT|nr:FecR domain-containing protein [Chitinophaga eiseniae]NLR79631.1 hypothetical protein [Chitinophaga eiseniae]
MIRSKIRAIIDKYLDNRATPAEEQLLTHWLDVISAEETPSDALTPGDKEQLRRKMLQTIRQRTGQPARTYPIWKRMVAAAAILLVAAIASWWIIQQRTSRPVAWLELSTGIGEMKKLVLPDSSTVWLEGNSRLKYPGHFRDKRDIELLYGDAFFDVSPYPQAPFTVYVDSLQVRVLGTFFHVRAYQQLPMEITVNSGKVSVSKHDQLMGLLTANQAMRINWNDYTFSRMEVSPLNISDWMRREIVFDNMPLKSVLHLLENYYRVKFEIESVPDMQITGSMPATLQPYQVFHILEELTDHQVIVQARGGNKVTVRHK